MDTYQNRRFSGILAYVAGAAFFVAVLMYLLWPDSLKYISYRTDFYSSILHQPLLFQLPFILFILFALTGLGVVMALQESTKDSLAPYQGILRWLSILAVIGLAVFALSSWYRMQNETEFAYSYTSLHSEFNGYGYSPFIDEDGKFWLNISQGSPIEKAGIKTGDQLLAVNGTPVEGKSAYQVVSLARQNGENGAVFQVQTPGETPRDVSVKPGQIALFDSVSQNAMDMLRMPLLDPDYMFGFGLFGVWLIVLNSLGMTGKKFPMLYAWAGIAAGVALLIFVLGQAVGMAVIYGIASIAGLVLLPAWLVWTGGTFWRK